jgi:hypothetical protein
VLVLLILCILSFGGGMMLKDNQELGDLPLLMAVIGAVAGIGAAILLLLVQIKIMVDRREPG